MIFFFFCLLFFLFLQFSKALSRSLSDTIHNPSLCESVSDKEKKERTSEMESRRFHTLRTKKKKNNMKTKKRELEGDESIFSLSQNQHYEGKS